MNVVQATLLPECISSYYLPIYIYVFEEVFSFHIYRSKLRTMASEKQETDSMVNQKLRHNFNTPLFPYLFLLSHIFHSSSPYFFIYFLLVSFYFLSVNFPSFLYLWFDFYFPPPFCIPFFRSPDTLLKGLITGHKNTNSQTAH